jgi:hypothetical protein
MENPFLSPTMLPEPLPHQVVDQETCSLSTLKCKDPLHNATDYLSHTIIPMASITIHQNLTSNFTSGCRLQHPLVQDQPIHTDKKLEPLKEFNSPENVEKLTSLHSSVVAARLTGSWLRLAGFSH